MKAGIYPADFTEWDLGMLNEHAFAVGDKVIILSNVVDERSRTLFCGIDPRYAQHEDSKNEALLAIVGSVGTIERLEQIHGGDCYRVTGIQINLEDKSYDLSQLLIPVRALALA